MPLRAENLSLVCQQAVYCGLLSNLFGVSLAEDEDRLFLMSNFIDWEARLWKLIYPGAGPGAA